MAPLFDDMTPAPQAGEHPKDFRRRHERFWSRVRIALKVVGAMALAAAGSLGTAAIQTPWGDKTKLWLVLGAGVCSTVAAGTAMLATELPRDPWPEQARRRRSSRAVPTTALEDKKP